MTLFLLIPVVAFVITVASAPIVMRLARHWGLVQPATRPRDIHVGSIARAGGIAMFLGFAVGAIASLLLPVEREDAHELTRFTGLLLGSTVAAVAGWADDRWEFGPGIQFAVQFLLGGIATATTIWIKHVNDPLGPGYLWDPTLGFPIWIVIPVTLAWYVGTINTVNWLDGLDGLAAGVAAIASAVFAAHMLRLGQLSVALLPLALLGATLGFLPFNFNPARTFMGSAGSYFLGYALAALAIIAGAKVASLLLVLAIPILDAAWLIVSRVRRGQSPMRGGRDHLHHRLYDAGLSQRQVVLSYWAVTAFFGLLALLLPARIYKLYALLLVGSLALLVLWALARRPVRAAES
ncbi:MAG TPA: MraY family glycosyltransferase [Ardenticatenaceae bacterium]|nr:MraY family glycosyltransferase [Ardenticatenaceae bacterium]